MVQQHRFERHPQMPTMSRSVEKSLISNRSSQARMHTAKVTARRRGLLGQKPTLLNLNVFSRQTRPLWVSQSANKSNNESSK
jgi:hypothetical protein